MSASKRNTQWIIYSFAIALLYAIIRYNIFKNVPWSDFPVYIFNKSVALTIIMLMFYYRTSLSKKLMSAEAVWPIMYFLAFTHLILSLTILNSGYFAKFYESSHLNSIGSLSLLSGVLAFIGFSIMGLMKLLKAVNVNFTINKLYVSILKFANMFFVITHVFIMGIKGWLTPNEWPGYLLPISLVAFLICLAAIMLSAYNKRKEVGKG